MTTAKNDTARVPASADKAMITLPVWSETPTSEGSSDLMLTLGGLVPDAVKVSLTFIVKFPFAQVVKQLIEVGVLAAREVSL